jgi:aspartate oxidase
MPGQPARAHTRSGTSPAIAAGSVAIIQQSLRSAHVFTADTLRQGRVACNRKTTSACAEAVNFADYLWKATEKIG